MSNSFHIIQTQAGSFHFVGNVPTDLAFISSKPDYINTAILCGPGFARKQAKREGGTFASRMFQTEAEARDFASNLGYNIA